MKKASKVLYILAGLAGLATTFLLLTFDLFAIGSFVYSLITDLTDNQPTDTVTIITYILDGLLDVGVLAIAGFVFIASVISFLGLINKKFMSIISLVFSILVLCVDFLILGLILLFFIGSIIYAIEALVVVYVVFIISALASAESIAGMVAIVYLIIFIIRIALLFTLGWAFIAAFVMFVLMLIASILSLKAIKKEKLGKENKNNGVEVIEVS